MREDDDRMENDGRSGGGKDRRGGGGRRPGGFRKKVCKFTQMNVTPDYKNPDLLRRFITERGKILPRRITGTCAKNQRALTLAVKRARVLAYLPFEKK